MGERRGTVDLILRIRGVSCSSAGMIDPYKYNDVARELCPRINNVMIDPCENDLCPSINLGGSVSLGRGQFWKSQ